MLSVLSGLLVLAHHVGGDVRKYWNTGAVLKVSGLAINEMFTTYNAGVEFLILRSGGPCGTRTLLVLDQSVDKWGLVVDISSDISS